MTSREGLSVEQEGDEERARQSSASDTEVSEAPDRHVARRRWSPRSLIGYGSDKWWKLEAIGLMVGTVVIAALATYNYVQAPLRVEFKLIDAATVQVSGFPSEIIADLLLFNHGTSRIEISSVSLQLVRHNPPRRHVIPARPESTGDSGTTLLLGAGNSTRRTMYFPLRSHDGTVGLGLDVEGHYVVEGSLLFSLRGEQDHHHTLSIEGILVSVRDGEIREVSGSDVTVRYVGD